MISVSPQISQSAAVRRNDICLYVSPADRSALNANIADRHRSSKAEWRAEIVLAMADGRQRGSGFSFRCPEIARV
jgi:hypothetical protein